jgi:hypothetical protein
MSEDSLSRILTYWADQDPDKPILTPAGKILSRAEREASSKRLMLPRDDKDL